MPRPTAFSRVPAGFAECRLCAYRDRGSSVICFRCASEALEPVALGSCETCGQVVADSGCANPLCGWSEADRFFRRVWPISMRTGEMKTAITRYKYDGKIGWAAIFGRILVGFLNSGVAVFRHYDLIIPSPTFVGLPGRSFDHIEMIVRAADVEEPLLWPFEFGVIEKVAPTRRMVDHKWRERKGIAEGELRRSLRVPDPSRVAGKRVIVVDDVFTEGFTLREVARALRINGATEVSEIVLAREPWKGP